MRVEDLIEELNYTLTIEHWKTGFSNRLHRKVIEEALKDCGVNQHSYFVLFCFVNYFYNNISQLEGREKEEKEDILKELADEVDIPLSFSDLMEWTPKFISYVDDILNNISDYIEVTCLYELLDTAHTKFVEGIGRSLIKALLANSEEEAV